MISRQLEGFSVAAVLPRYGESLGGGAETLTKGLIEQLALRGARVEVWTTCASDHRTWENALPPGQTIEQGIPVSRFVVDERNLEVFIGAELRMRDGERLNVGDELAWLGESVNSRALYAHIAAYGKCFDAILFAPYLFATTFWGALIYPERSVLIPCLHDEHYAYQPVFKSLFQQVRGIFFNAAPEMEFARELYQLPDFEAKSEVVGMGFQDIASDSEDSTARPYLLYSGRKEQGKNLDLLIEYFRRFRERAPESALELRLIGAGEINFLDTLPEGVVDLGFVSEEEKKRQMAGALALCQPSRNESFSIVLMESWLLGTPVIVHGQCSVTKHHVVQSGGGLYFSNDEEFLRVVDLLTNDAVLARRMGANGRQYVLREYNWESVVQRAARGFSRVGLLPVLEQAA